MRFREWWFRDQLLCVSVDCAVSHVNEVSSNRLMCIYTTEVRERKVNNEGECLFDRKS
jgi:hypothetical protein